MRAQHRFHVADIAGCDSERGGRVYLVRLPLGHGKVFVSEAAVDRFGERLSPAFIARRLNDFAARLSDAEAFAYLGRDGDAVELALDGVIET